MANQPRKQHIVPQLILRNFCADSTSRIFVFDKSTSKSFTSNPLDAGQQNRFYNDSGSATPHEMETRLSVLEGVCAPILKKIISTRSLRCLSELEHKILCLFVSVQYQRTNRTREQLSDVNQNTAVWIKKLGYDPENEVDNFQVLAPEEIKKISIQLLRELSLGLAVYLTDKKINLLVSEKESAFLISDNPVNLYNHTPIEGRGNLGFRNKGIEIFFPISPHVCLSFFLF